MRVPNVELLWWEGCPSTDRALAELRAALAGIGLDGLEIAMREIRTDEDAVSARFGGSPTILIDGVDVVATPSAGGDGGGDGGGGGGGPTEPIGLSCRVYRRRDGRISPTPDPDDLREALAAASER